MQGLLTLLTFLSPFITTQKKTLTTVVPLTANSDFS